MKKGNPYGGKETKKEEAMEARMMKKPAPAMKKMMKRTGKRGA